MSLLFSSNYQSFGLKQLKVTTYESFNRLLYSLACNCGQTSIMGILKVVCVWCDCVRDCGLIIWGFNHLSIVHDI